MDIATLFSDEEKSALSTKSNPIHVLISAKKLTPKALSQVAASIHQNGANIERVTRLASNPLTTIEFVLSGATKETLTQSLSPIAISNSAEITVQ